MRRRVEFDGSYRVANRTRMVKGNTYETGLGQRLRYVHPPSLCEGRHCVVHNPSDHCMRLFPTLWRADRQIMERLCPHGIGHPDPDDQAYLISRGLLHEGVHGCDGCCGIKMPHAPDCSKVQGYPDDCNCGRNHSAE